MHWGLGLNKHWWELAASLINRILLSVFEDEQYFSFLMALFIVFFWFEEETTKHKRRSRPLTMTKRKRRLLPFVPAKDPLQRDAQLRTLASALTSLNMKYSNELTYVPGMAPRSANQSMFEIGGVQVRKEQKEIQIFSALFKNSLTSSLLGASKRRFRDIGTVSSYESTRRIPSSCCRRRSVSRVHIHFDQIFA